MEEKMKNYKEWSLSQILLIVLDVILILGVIITAIVYYNTFLKYTGDLNGLNKFIMFILLTVGIVCIFLIVLELRKIVLTLNKGNPFVWLNVRALKRISVECFIIAACYFGNFIVNFGKNKYKFIYLDSKGIHTDTEPIIFILAGVFIAILANVFKKAIEYKEENDFTI
ncbi:DUF2975 domain-containing protein [Clostridium botulinum C/D]|nr:hypothetical protein CbC4_1561 [Clostridium botulinum BKT015925]MCD3196734.1 DUF2975 domain-containing protein [Clostridium botulinum C/D]NFF28845.1 DUF2975 domain-containing protein [Clostridium botulinum]MCD3201581.1 DUF2975 domain-containing protein [Clostridium botulinum C/D]MCD3211556.1 DUF2975 domain-containing protein [Clostridium botulinum C/D]